MFNYTYYPGSPQFFVQDKSDGKDLPAVLPRFGLVDESNDRWTTFWGKIAQLNETGKAHQVEYKVFFLGRHGEGVHNIAAEKYDLSMRAVAPGPVTTKPVKSLNPANMKEDWYRYWSHRYTDGVLTWGPDPNLTNKGYCDAAFVHVIWTQELQAKIGLPQTVYCSPFTRTLCTNTLTFNGLDGYDPTHTVVVENTRGLSVTQTPEQRRSMSYMKSMFTTFSFEQGFSENDPIWDPAFPETGTDVQNRARTVLDGIFSHQSGPFVSLTTHDDFIDAFCRVIGRPLYAIKPGGVLPVVVCKSVTANIPTPPLLPGTYTIYSVANPKLIMSVGDASRLSAIPDDSVIADEAIFSTCQWDVSSASEGCYYMRVHENPKNHTVVQKSPLGLPEVHVGDSKEEPEYAIESDGMGRYKICIPSTGTRSVYTYNGRYKQIYVTAEIVNNDAQDWYFEAVTGTDGDNFKRSPVK